MRDLSVLSALYVGWAEGESRETWQERVRSAARTMSHVAGFDLGPGVRYEIRSRTYDFGHQREFFYVTGAGVQDLPVTGLLDDPEPLDARPDDPVPRDPRRSGFWFHGRLEVPR